MSYTIFYDKQFVKLLDGTYLPFIEMGDNNVWEWNNKRRSRDYELHFALGKKSGRPATKEEIIGYADELARSALNSANTWRKNKNEPETTMDNIKKDIGGQIGLEIRGAGRCNASYDDIMGFMKSGIRRALTIEDLASVNVYASAMFEENKEKGLDLIDIKLDSEENISKMYELLKDRYAYVRLFGMSDYTKKRIARQFFPRKKPVKKAVDPQNGYFVEVSDGIGRIGFFLRGGVRKGFKYLYGSGKAFQTKELAQKKADELAKGNFTEANHFKVLSWSEKNSPETCH